MKPGLDTSVVVRLLLREPAGLAEAARRFVEEAARDPEGSARISDLVVGEAYFVLLHHYRVPHADAIRALHTLLTDARLHAEGAAREVLEELVATPAASRKGAGLMDRLIHGDYRRAGAKMITFDRVASRLPDARMLRA